VRARARVRVLGCCSRSSTGARHTHTRTPWRADTARARATPPRAQVVEVVDATDVVCVARNDALLDGLLTVFHVERSSDELLNLQNDLPLLSDYDKECILSLAAVRAWRVCRAGWVLTRVVRGQAMARVLHCWSQNLGRNARSKQGCCLRTAALNTKPHGSVTPPNMSLLPHTSHVTRRTMRLTSSPSATPAALTTWSRRAPSWTQSGCTTQRFSQSWRAGRCVVV
jgi:hypothetical protein